MGRIDKKQTGYQWFCISDRYGNIDHDLQERISKEMAQGWHVVGNCFEKAGVLYHIMVKYD